jgi:hypothetical protein
LSGLAHPLQYEPSLDNLPYTTLSYGNGPGYNLAGRQMENTNEIFNLDRFHLTLFFVDMMIAYMYCIYHNEI